MFEVSCFLSLVSNGGVGAEQIQTPATPVESQSVLKICNFLLTSLCRSAVDLDDSSACLAEEPLMSQLTEALVEHHLPVMTLGSGRTTLQDIFLVRGDHPNS